VILVTDPGAHGNEDQWGPEQVDLGTSVLRRTVASSDLV
jgi:hypothetical protein